MKQRLAGGELAGERYLVSLQMTARVVAAVHLLAPRPRAAVFGRLAPRSTRVLLERVSEAEGGRIRGDDEPRSHPVARDRRLRRLESGDRMLVEVAADEDPDAAVARRVERCAQRARLLEV